MANLFFNYSLRPSINGNYFIPVCNKKCALAGLKMTDIFFRSPTFFYDDGKVVDIINVLIYFLF